MLKRFHLTGNAEWFCLEHKSLTSLLVWVVRFNYWADLTFLLPYILCFRQYKVLWNKNRRENACPAGPCNASRGKELTEVNGGEWHKKTKRKVLWFFWRERFGNIGIDSLHWKPCDLSMPFGISECFSICINMNKKGACWQSKLRISTLTWTLI